ncbi:MAG: right-handed parallel beta-helix repeat-containing protein [Myxococcota bacterium]
MRQVWMLLVLVAACGGDDSAADAGAVDADRADAGGRDDAARPDSGASCGDGVCGASERCDTCEVDCGMCEVEETECNDGIDNDGDGLVDWQLDVGCWGAGDRTEASGPRDAENGWTTFDLAEDSRVVFVSAEGDDAADGLTPETAVASVARGAELVRDGFPDFLLFRRGDTWRETLGADRRARRFKSGRSPTERLVLGSYGDATERPRFEVDTNFLDDDGHGRANLAIVGLALVSYRKDPADPDFNGADGGAFRFVSAESHDVLMEDNYLEYGEFVIQNGRDYELRRNVVYRSYHVGTCAYNPDGSRNPNGSPEFRPSGIFAGRVDGLLIESNVWDENGWNPDVEEACATIFNHDLYLSGCSRLVVRDNLILRASSIGIKMASSGPGASDDILIEGNLFAEGEIGISMGGNADTDNRFRNAVVRNNVFTDVGRSQPTGRTLTWYMTISDNDGTEIAGNLLVNQPLLGNPLGISLRGDTNRVVIENNEFYAMDRRALELDGASAWEVEIRGNTIVQGTDNDCLVDQDRGGSVRFEDNAYGSGASENWFCVDGDRLSAAEWRSAQESSASEVDPDYERRNLDSYAESLGIGDSLAEFAEAARGQSRLGYRSELTAARANAYIREGFAR